MKLLTKLPFLIVGIIGSLGCEKFQAQRPPLVDPSIVKIESQEAPVADAVTPKPPVKSRPQVSVDDSSGLQNESITESATYGVDPNQIIRPGADVGINEALDRGAALVVAEAEKNKLEGERILKERKEQSRKIQEKYARISPILEEMNKDLIAAKVKELEMSSPESWPLQGLRIKIYEKDTFDMFEIPGSEELRKGDRNNSLVTLNVDNKENLFVMFDNKISVDSEALRITNFRGYGAICKYRMSGTVREGDVLEFVKTNFDESHTSELSKKQAWSQALMTQVTFFFKDVTPESQKSLEVHCEIKTNRIGPQVVGFRFVDFVDNFVDVFGFQVKGGTWTQPSKFFGRDKQGNQQVGSFEIVDIERLKVADSSDIVDFQLDAGLMFMEGIILTTASAEEMIVKGFAKHACGIFKRSGDLSAGQRFQKVKIEPGQLDHIRNFADYGIVYESEDKKTTLGISCYSRRAGGVPPEIIESTFRNVLKFGVLEQKD